MIINKDNIVALVGEFLNITKASLLEHGTLSPVALILSENISVQTPIRLRINGPEMKQISKTILRTAMAHLRPEAVVVISEGTMDVEKPSRLMPFRKVKLPVPCIAVFAASPSAIYGVTLEVLSENNKPVGFGKMEEGALDCFFTKDLWRLPHVQNVQQKERV